MPDAHDGSIAPLTRRPSRSCFWLPWSALTGDTKAPEAPLRKLFAWLLAFELATVAALVVYDLVLSPFAEPWVLSGLSLVRVLATLALAWRDCRPLQVSLQDDAQLQLEQLRAAERTLASLPGRMIVMLRVGWIGVFGVALTLAWFALVGTTRIGPVDLFYGSMLALMTVFLFPSMIRSLFGHAMRDSKLWIHEQLRARGEEPQYTHRSLEREVFAFPMGIAASMCFALVGTVVHERADLVRAHSLDELSWRAQLASSQQGQDELERAALEPGLRVVASADELPSLLRSALGDGKGSLRVLDPRRDRSMVALPLAEGRWLLAEGETGADRELLLGLLMLVLSTPLALASMGMASFAFSRALARPVTQLEQATRSLADEGDLRGFARLVPERSDELGRVAVNLNRMVDVFDELAAAASSVSEGDFSVELAGRGDLPEAFRAMVEQLHQLASQIRSTSADLARAAAEIRASTQHQERAVAQQSGRVLEVNETMRGLAQASSSIDRSAREVLANAEQALRTNEVVVGRIDALIDSSGRVGELLEMVREIADRSDILALNGALEATRAGEGGHGFALVAAEMRRLAERVTHTVAEVRERIVDIGAAAAGAVNATGRSREIAESTAATAREISAVSAGQDQRTRDVSQQVSEVDAQMGNTVEAARQALSASEDLRHLALELERLTGRFKLRGDRGAESGAA